jgi:hypothetical protein
MDRINLNFMHRAKFIPLRIVEMPLDMCVSDQNVPSVLYIRPPRHLGPRAWRRQQRSRRPMLSPPFQDPAPAVTVHDCHSSEQRAAVSFDEVEEGASRIIKRLQVLMVLWTLLLLVLYIWLLAPHTSVWTWNSDVDASQDFDDLTFMDRGLVVYDHVTLYVHKAMRWGCAWRATIIAYVTCLYERAAHHMTLQYPLHAHSNADDIAHMWPVCAMRNDSSTWPTCAWHNVDTLVDSHPCDALHSSSSPLLEESHWCMHTSSATVTSTHMDVLMPLIQHTMIPTMVIVSDAHPALTDRASGHMADRATDHVTDRATVHVTDRATDHILPTSPPSVLPHEPYNTTYHFPLKQMPVYYLAKGIIAIVHACEYLAVETQTVAVMVGMALRDAEHVMQHWILTGYSWVRTVFA